MKLQPARRTNSYCISHFHSQPSPCGRVTGSGKAESRSRNLASSGPPRPVRAGTILGTFEPSDAFHLRLYDGPTASPPQNCDARDIRTSLIADRPRLRIFARYEMWNVGAGTMCVLTEHSLQPQRARVVKKKKKGKEKENSEQAPTPCAGWLAGIGALSRVSRMSRQPDVAAGPPPSRVRSLSMACARAEVRVR